MHQRGLARCDRGLTGEFGYVKLLLTESMTVGDDELRTKVTKARSTVTNVIKTEGDDGDGMMVAKALYLSFDRRTYELNNGVCNTFVCSRACDLGWAGKIFVFGFLSSIGCSDFRGFRLWYPCLLF